MKSPALPARLASLALLLWAATGSESAAAAPPEAPVQPIVLPLPVRRTPLGRDLPLGDGFVLVIERPSDAATIGAGLLLDRLQEAGADTGRVVVARAPEPGRCNILLAEAGDAGSGAAAAFLRRHPAPESRLPQLSQGYTVTFAGTDVLVLGRDSAGLLYGCVTLAQLVASRGGAPVLAASEIDDWPTFEYRCIKILEAGHETEPERKAAICRRLIDEALLRKNNVFDIYHRLLEPLHGQQELMDPVAPEEYAQYAWLRDVIRYGQRRGMYFMVYTGVAVADDRKPADDPRLKDMMRIGNRVYTWSEDDLIERNAGNVAAFCAYLGVKIVAFHYADTVNENWVNRGPLDRERFGDDRVAADAHLTQVLHRTLRRHDPEMMLCPSIHPYSATYLRHAYYEEFCRALNERIPPDVRPALREYRAEAFQRMCRAYGNRPVKIYYQNVGIARDAGLVIPMLETGARFFKSFFNGNRGSFFMVNGIHSLLQDHLYSQYLWNADAPGAQIDYRWADTYSIFNGAGNPAFFESVLLPVCIRVFGAEAAPQMCDLFRLGLHNSFLIDPFAVKKHRERSAEHDWEPLPPIDWDAKLQEQLAGLEEADALVSELARHPGWFATPVSRETFLRYYREVRVLRRVGGINAERWAAARLAAGGDLAAAGAALDRAVGLVEEAKALLPGELTLDPSFGPAPPTVRFRMQFPKPASQTFHLPETLDGYLETLAEARKGLGEAAAGSRGTPLSGEDLRIAGEKRWTAMRADAKVTLDGRLDEAVWQRAPRRPFIETHPEDAPPALLHPDARGTAQAAWTPEFLYLALALDEETTDSLLGTTGSRDANDLFAEDTFEIFLQPPPGPEYAHLACNVAGRKRDGATETNELGVFTNLQWNPDWETAVRIDPDAGQWTVEIRIPFAVFGAPHFPESPASPAPGWRINVGRSRRNTSFSAVIPCRSFHQRDDYLELVFE